MPTGFGRGYVSAETLKRSDAFIRKCRAETRERERAEIAALSNLDIQKAMARVIITRAVAAGCILRRDFIEAAIPKHRIDKNLDAAMRLARKQEPKLDAMLRQPCAA